MRDRKPGKPKLSEPSYSRTKAALRVKRVKASEELAPVDELSGRKVKILTVGEDGSERMVEHTLPRRR